MNLAEALSRTEGMPVVILTSNGAKKYFDYNLPKNVVLQEIFGRTETSSADSTWLRIYRLVMHNLRLYIWVRSKNLHLLVLEEPRFPIVRILQANRKVLVVHNAKLHTTGRAALSYQVKSRLQSLLLSTCNQILTHGQSQAEAIRRESAVPVHHVALPSVGWVEERLESPDNREPHVGEGDYLLCVGEIRWNKGFDIAARAAIRANVRLVVAGSVVDQESAAVIENLVADNPRLLDYRPAFVEKQQFDQLIRGCRAIVIPYRDFQAQSGIVEQARRYNKRIVCSDLPALREQCGPHWPIWVIPGDEADLAHALSNVWISEGTERVDSVGRTQWEEVAYAVSGSVFAEIIVP
ncbi:hypothetical protein AB0P23_10385 [Rhodococcus sp. NPDC077669]|uniref:hypothetical protein n=1 Tax=Rhodococcus sp. NPDC077669 TaxID=3155174 RepID=UPI003427246D